MRILTFTPATALDDSTSENGAMRMINFTALPASRNNCLPVQDAGGMDDGKGHFFIGTLIDNTGHKFKASLKVH